MRSFRLARTMLMLGAVLTLAACASVSSPSRSDSSPSLRCMNEPGRGGSSDSSRPLFFVFCAQSP